MLRVRPQISENGTVKMAIYQEVSKIDQPLERQRPTTSKRSIESNVLVDDGAIIVLGGLLEDLRQAEDKVPAGRHPLVGNLFRSENRTRKKTNLMVFLRPVVVRDNATSDALMMDRYEAIRAAAGQQPAPARCCGNVRCAPAAPLPHGPLLAQQRPRAPGDAPPPALRLCPHQPAAAGGRRPAARAVARPAPRPAPGRGAAQARRAAPAALDAGRWPSASAPPMRRRIQRRHGGQRGRADADLSRMMQELPAVEDLLEAADDAPIIRMLNALLTQAARDGASDIHIEPYERHSACAFAWTARCARWCSPTARCTPR
jgi:type II secretory ATPase GspE/PulE/Tfp pilus assembly ATPase PilB-like protein